MKLKKRDRYLLAAMLNIIWFAIAVLVVNASGNEVSEALIVGWYAAWTIELAAVAGITVKKGSSIEDRKDEEEK